MMMLRATIHFISRTARLVRPAVIAAITLRFVGCASVPTPAPPAPQAQPDVIVRPIHTRVPFDSAIQHVAQAFSGFEGRVAVLDFPNLDQQPTWIGKLTSQSLTSSLVSASQSGSAHVLERLQVDQVLNELRFEAATMRDADVQRLGDALGADALIFGTAAPLGTDVVLNARMVDVHTRAIIAADKETFTMPTPADAGVGARPLFVARRDMNPAAHGTLAPERGGQMRNGWDFAAPSCELDGPYLVCTVTAHNLGGRRFVHFSVCSPDVSSTNLPDCSRVSMAGAETKPVEFVSANQFVVDGLKLGQHSGFNVLDGRTATMVVRAENPPAGIGAVHAFTLRVDGDDLNSDGEELVFHEVPIVAMSRPSPFAASVASLGFRFDLTACHRVDRVVECEVGITNLSSARALGFDESQTIPAVGWANRATDNTGHTYQVRRFSFAADRRFAAGATIPLRFAIEGVDPRATALTIDLAGRASPLYPYVNSPAPEFRAVPITP